MVIPLSRKYCLIYLTFIYQPLLSRKHEIYDFFLDPYYLFKLPAFALVAGLLLIDRFISSTNAKIAAEKKAKAAKEAAKKKAWKGDEGKQEECF